MPARIAICHSFPASPQALGFLRGKCTENKPNRERVPARMQGLHHFDFGQNVGQTMQRLIRLLAIRWSAFLDRLLVRRRAGGVFFGPLLIDRGRGLLYDVERDLTWLQDTNYAKTVGHAPDGQMTWDKARAWVARLNYKGVTGWRLPTARNPDGSGPCIGDNCRESELGHLVFTAFQRPAPGTKLVNWEPFSIYWSSTEASPTEAFAFKMAGLKQGELPKDPWAPDPALGGGVPLADVVRTWPVHDGDVAAGFFRRLLEAALQLVIRE